MASKPLKGLSLLLLTLALGLGTFIQILDLSIANVSIPAIAGDLDVSLNQGTWIITSFAISNAIVLALTGWLSLRFGNARLFIWSTALFSLTSWLCGLSWNLSALVFFRVLQGASAGILIPISQALLMLHYPVDKKGMALGFWAMIVTLAPIFGPLLGGYITDQYGWPWIFYINIPIGLFSSWLTWVLIGDEIQPIHYEPIDRIGLGLLTLGIGSLQILLDRGHELDWLDSNFILTLVITAVLSFLFFFIWNLFSEHPIIDFSVFKNRSFVIGTLMASIGFVMFFGSNVLLPLWLQSQKHYTAFWAGVAVMPIGIIPLLSSSFVGHLAGKIDPRLMTTFSFLCFSLTFFYFSHLSPDVSIRYIMLLRFVQGLALAFFFIPLVTLALSPFSQDALTNASGIFNFIRLVAGGGIGTALSVTLWNQREGFHYARLIENISAYHPPLYNSLPLTLTEEATYSIIENILTQQASLLAINDVFWLASWIFLFCTPIVWLAKPPTQISEEVIALEIEA